MGRALGKAGNETNESGICNGGYVMSVITYNTLKMVGKAYQLKTDRAIGMFDDLWEVYQVGNKYKRGNEKVLAKEVEKSYATLTEIFKTKTARAPGNGFSRIGVAQNHALVIFSDHHMTYRGIVMIIFTNSTTRYIVRYFDTMPRKVLRWLKTAIWKSW
jgi:hypothetical protein